MRAFRAISQLKGGRIHLRTAPFLLLLLAAACSTLGTGSASYGVGYTQHGHASWYGPGFDGKAAANGETYDQNALTAAHRYLPFGTQVEVTRQDTGDRVIVRITDRGPFVRGRILDLSHAAARQLHAIGPGVVPIQLRVVSSPLRPDATPYYTVQLGRFEDEAATRRFIDTLAHRIREVRVVSDTATGSLRVVTPPYGSYERAAEVARHIRSRLRLDAFVIKDPLIGHMAAEAAPRSATEQDARGTVAEVATAATN